MGVRRWRSGATSPAIQDALLDEDGDPINLTGATIEFLMFPATGGSAVVNAAGTVVGAATLGVVQYPWGTADLSTPGLYKGYWKITYSGGAIEILPQGGTFPGDPDELLIRITDDLT